MTASATPARAEVVRAIAQGQHDQPGALLPILHDVMAECGYIDSDDLPILADVLNLSVAEVRGVVSFYHDFKTAAPAQHQIVLCRAEACQSLGAQRLFDTTTLRAQSGAWGDSVEVREAFCFGNCALAPAGTIDGQLIGRLNETKIDAAAQTWCGQ